MRLLILGGTVFLGRALTDALHGGYRLAFAAAAFAALVAAALGCFALRRAAARPATLGGAPLVH